jgi:hypothetical protein
VDLEPAVLPADLEEILGRYPHLTQHQAAQPDEERALPAAAGHPGTRRRMPSRRPCTLTHTARVVRRSRPRLATWWCSAGVPNYSGGM